MPEQTMRSLRTAAVAATVALACAPAAAPASYRPGEVVVRYAAGVDRAERAAIQRSTGTGGPRPFAPWTRTLEIRDGESVAETVRELERRPGVVSANPVHIARASAFYPNDPGATGQPAGWAQMQWNFLPGTGVNAPDAWENLIRAGRPGGAGVTVAVLDTGLAYSSRGRFRRSPDISPRRLRAGFDFVEGNSRPYDRNGHGTHVASTIAETANNGIGLTGLAYGARIMPVRVLDATGAGAAPDIARGIRYAARNGAKVINLSFEFDPEVTSAGIPEVLSALRYADSRGALVVGASGNASARAVAYPARSPLVMSVGAVTERGCMADYSSGGPGLDIAAPGGGPDATLADDPRCRPADQPGRDIFQLTFLGSVRRFGIPSGYVGTSMAAPHVSATAALVIASGVIGPNPSPRQVKAHLKRTSTDHPPKGPDSRYGAGVVDAARATTPLR